MGPLQTAPGRKDRPVKTPAQIAGDPAEPPHSSPGKREQEGPDLVPLFIRGLFPSPGMGRLHQSQLLSQLCTNVKMWLTGNVENGGLKVESNKIQSLSYQKFLSVSAATTRVGSAV